MHCVIKRDDLTRQILIEDDTRACNKRAALLLGLAAVK